VFKRTRSIGVLFMLLVVALAMMGMAYSHWSKILTIDGVVQTGSLGAELSLKAGDPWENDPQGVAECTAVLLDVDGCPGYDKLHVEIANGYPYYECLVRFDVHNSGQLPVIVDQPVWVQLPPPEEVWVYFPECYPNDSVLYQSDEVWCALYLKVKQPAKQGWTYALEATIEAQQYEIPDP
jgi:hypothetical protein